MQDDVAVAQREWDPEKPIMDGGVTPYVKEVARTGLDKKPPVGGATVDHSRTVVMELDALRVRLRAKEQEYTVVQGSSLTLHEGRVLGLIGESGCGKSVTCLALMGLLEPDEWSISGSVRLGSREIDYANREGLRQLRGGEISMIMQNPIGSFNPIFTVGEHFVETVCSHRGLGRREARAIGVEMLRRINIREPERVMSQYPFQLSGGMLQRVMIAIALFMKPRVLIADEPTTSLDVTVQYQILSELAALKDEFNTAILLVSHDLGVVAQMADEVAVMYGGYIVEQAPVREIFHNPLHPYTHALMHAKPAFTKERLCMLEGYPPTITSLNGGCPFMQRCPQREEQCATHDMAPIAVTSFDTSGGSSPNAEPSHMHPECDACQVATGHYQATHGTRHVVRCAAYRTRTGVLA